MGKIQEIRKKLEENKSYNLELSRLTIEEVEYLLTELEEADKQIQMWQKIAKNYFEQLDTAKQENERLKDENKRLDIATHIDVSLGNTVCEMQTEIDELSAKIVSLHYEMANVTQQLKQVIEALENIIEHETRVHREFAHMATVTYARDALKIIREGESHGTDR